MVASANKLPETDPRVPDEDDHPWHSAINGFVMEPTGAEVGRQFNYRKEARFMYRAKELASEVPRMIFLFAKEREGKLTKIHRQCSHSEAEPVVDNHLTCCFGVECRKCPMLLALDQAKLTPESIDRVKAWTCAAHIIGAPDGIDTSEGFLLTEDDKMFWARVYESMAQGEVTAELVEEDR